MPGKNRPSQQAGASRVRQRRSRARRYEAQGARFTCRFCPVALPTVRGRSVHESTIHECPL